MVTEHEHPYQYSQGQNIVILGSHHTTYYVTNLYLRPAAPLSLGPSAI